jgi:hypothetical protein
MQQSNTESVSIKPTELSSVISSMISLHTIIKEKRLELKKVNEAYKAISVRAKEHMRSTDIQYIDMGGHQIQTYKRERESPMNADFIVDGCKQFFKSHNLQSLAETPDVFSRLITEFLFKLKKDKHNATEIWTITIRNIKQKQKKVQEKKSKQCESIINNNGTPIASKPVQSSINNTKKQCLKKQRVQL